MPNKDINIVDSIFNRPQKNKNISTLFTSKLEPKIKIKPLFKKGDPLGLDIGTNSFKIANIVSDEQGLVLSNLIIEEFSWDVINNPEKKKEVLPQILKMMMEKYKLPSGVYASISPSLAQIKNIRLPPIPRDEIEGALNWEIQQTSLTKREEIVFDYIVLNEEAFLKKDAIDILAIISLKKDVLDYMQILTSAGFRPLAIEIDPISAISCLNFMNQIDANEIILFLEMGAGVSTLSVIENSQLRLIRNVSLKGNQLNSFIKDALKIQPEEAEEAKKAVDCLNLDNVSDVSAATSSGIANIIKANLETLILDIEHTFKYYSYQLTGSRVEWFNRLILSGGCALLKNIDKYLSNHLEVPVQVADPLRRLNISQDVKNIFPDINMMLPRLSVCIGLALRGQVKEQ